MTKNIIEQFEQDQIVQMTADKTVPEFRAGDSLKVSVKVIEGSTARNQIYEGVVIAKRNRGIASSFVVRKMSHGEGVERRFMIYSPTVVKIEVVKRGVVRRAKLYYLRNLSGRAARIQERKFFVKK